VELAQLWGGVATPVTTNERVAEAHASIEPQSSIE
jgi:hypothetical protein